MKGEAEDSVASLAAAYPTGDLVLLSWLQDKIGRQRVNPFAGASGRKRQGKVKRQMLLGEINRFGISPANPGGKIFLGLPDGHIDRHINAKAREVRSPNMEQNTVIRQPLALLIKRRAGNGCQGLGVAGDPFGALFSRPIIAQPFEPTIQSGDAVGGSVVGGSEAAQSRFRRS